LIERFGQKTAFLVVNDNKKPRQNRAAILTIEGRAAPQYAKLRWLGDDLPVDLEAVTGVPGAANNFMALLLRAEFFISNLTASIIPSKL
jgi:hypothetical protein